MDDLVLEVLQAIYLVAAIAKTIHELWREYKHPTDDAQK